MMNMITINSLVKNLPLSIRVRNTHRRDGVFTVRAILRKGKQGLYLLPGIGTLSLKEIDNMLDKAGIELPEGTAKKVA